MDTRYDDPTTIAAPPAQGSQIRGGPMTAPQPFKASRTITVDAIRYTGTEESKAEVIAWVDVLIDTHPDLDAGTRRLERRQTDDLWVEDEHDRYWPWPGCVLTVDESGTVSVWPPGTFDAAFNVVPDLEVTP